jgi:M6 family metalloprotease-like protein
MKHGEHAAHRFTIKSAYLLIAQWVPWGVILITIPAAWGMPPNPNPIKVRQPDGTEIVLRMRGGEGYHWFEDLDGFTVVLEEGVYRYAKLGTDKRLAATDLVVGRVEPRRAGLQPHILPPRDVLEREQAAYLSEPQDPTRAASGVPPVGPVKNLVVLCKFSNHTFGVQTRPEADYDVLFNAVGGHPTLAPTGSVRDLYLENSYGTLTLDSTVVAWVTLPQTEAYYANGQSGTGYGFPQNAQGMVRDALDLVDPLVDFGEFDTDNDGYIDAISIVHSGYGAEFGGNPNRIWSHRWSLWQLPGGQWTSGDTNGNGVAVKVYPYHTEPALWGTSGTQISRIGVIAHEIGHFFGLPDLYDINGGGQGIGSWGMMANSWGFTGDQLNPPHFSAWSKIFLGWVTPTVISTPGTYSAPQVVTNPVVYRIDQGFPAGEYLLIENRQPVGIESTIPQGGLAIWHIDEAKSGNTDQGYPGQSGWPQNNQHYKVALLQADGDFDLERGLNRGDSGDPYHGQGACSLGPDTSPNTDAYQNGVISATGIAISVLDPSGSSMDFEFGGFSDCNGNGQSDACEIASGAATDCNANAIPDDCEFTPNTTSISYPIAANLAIPDGDLAGIDDVFEVPDSGLIHDLDVAVDITHAWIGDLTIRLEHEGVEVVLWDSQCGSTNNMDVIFDDEGSVILCAQLSDQLRLPPYAELIGGSGLTAFDGLDRAGTWTLTLVDDYPADPGVLVDWTLTFNEFQPGPGDCDGNGIFDACESFTDCNTNGIADVCEPDCNTNGVADACDISDLTSTDFNTNGIPDDCEGDCNTNAVPDDYDIATGGSEDCNTNGIPDECDLLPPGPSNADCTGSDTDGDGVVDVCDNCPLIANPGQEDADSNGVGDVCPLDCNSNGVPDECDVSDCPPGDPTCADCNANDLLDGCELALGVASDCNGNGVPDDCDIAGTTSIDCNGNGTPDDCDIAAGSATDLNTNGLIDACEQIYVDADQALPFAQQDGTSWATAYAYLQDALDRVDALQLAGVAGTIQIWVAEGIYYPDRSGADPDGSCTPGPCDRAATFQLRDNVELYGGFAGAESELNQRDVTTSATILTGDIDSDFTQANNCYHVTNGSGTEQSAVLDGFTVRHGNANGAGGGTNLDRGAGMINEPSGSPTVRNCIFTENFSLSGGAGMSNGDAGIAANPTIEDCRFVLNTSNDDGGAVLNRSNSHPIFIRCIFDSNTGNVTDLNGGGGAISNNSGSSTIRGCTFTNNSTGTVSNGGAIYNSGGNLVLVDSTFASNSASEGGAIYATATTITIHGCSLHDNAASPGAGGGLMATANSGVSATQSDFIGNASAVHGGALLLAVNSLANYSDCRFVNNSADGDNEGGGAIATNSGSQAIFSGCVFVGNASNGAIPTDPNQRPGGGAILVNSGSYVTATRSTFAGNTASSNGDGGAIRLANASEASLSNCAFAGNESGQHGGAINITGGASPASTVTATNCTFSENRAGNGAGGAVHIGSGSMTFINSVVWNNLWFKDVYVSQAAGTPAAIFNHTTIDEGVTGIGGCPTCGVDQGGNTASDPQFVGGVSGTWTANATTHGMGQTILTDANANGGQGFVENELVGKFLNPNTNGYLQSLITSNGPNTIVVWGDFTAEGTSGTTYQINDYRLGALSPAIDAGEPAGAAMLAGYWRLDEGSGTMAFDNSGNGLDGTLIGPPAWSAGITGSSLEFGPSLDYVEVPHDPVLNFSAGFSVSFWINAPATQPGSPGTAPTVTIIDKSHSFPGATVSGWAVQARSAEPGQISFVVGTNTGFPEPRVPGVLDNSWHHVALTVSVDPSLTILGYVDGVLKTRFEDASTDLVNNTGSLLFGRFWDTIGRQFEGRLDEIQVYAGVLSSGEVQVLAGANDLSGAPRVVDIPWRNGSTPIVDMGAYERQVSDCNTNGVDDALDIAGGTAEDCNTNGIVDSCEAGGVATLEDFYILVSSSNSSGVFQYASDGTPLGKLVNSGGQSLGIDFGPDGNLYGVFNAGGVKRFVGANGAFIDNFVPFGTGGLGDANALTFGPDGNLYVVDVTNSAVLRFDGVTGAPLRSALGAVGTAEFVPPGSNGLVNPNGLAFGPNGDLYVGNNPDVPAIDSVYRFSGLDGSFVEIFTENVFGCPTGSDSCLDAPFDPTFGPDGNLYVVSNRSDRVLRYNGTTGDFIDFFIDSPAGGLIAPQGIGFGPDGNAYVADWTGTQGRIRKYDGATGAFISEIVPPGTGGLGDANFLLFVTDCNANGIPDECEEDSNGNGLPDACDMADFPSFWTGNGDGFDWLDATNWSPMRVPDNLPAGTPPESYFVTIGEPGGFSVDLFDPGITIETLDIGSAVSLNTLALRHPLTVNQATNIASNGEIVLRKEKASTGSLLGGPVTVADGGRLATAGLTGGPMVVSGNMSNFGTLETGALQDLNLTGTSFRNERGGSVVMNSGASLKITSASVYQGGFIETDGNVTVTVENAPLINTTGAIIVLNGGLLDVDSGLINEAGATVTGVSGQIDGDITNAGAIAFQGDLTLNGDLTTLPGGITTATGDFNVTGTTQDFTVDGGSMEFVDAAGANRRLAGNTLTALNWGTIRFAGSATVELDSALTLESGAVYEASAPTSAALTAPAVTLGGGLASGPRMSLSHNMSADVGTLVVLDGPCLTLTRGCSPPVLNVVGQAQLVLSQDLIIGADTQVEVNSSQPVQLAGDFDNRSRLPGQFDWTSGTLLLDGVGQVFEVAGVDRGAIISGFAANYAIGEIEVAGSSAVVFENAIDNDFAPDDPCAEVLYVETFVLRAGATITLDNTIIYYQHLVDEGATVNQLGCSVLAQVTQLAGDFDGDGDVDLDDHTVFAGCLGGPGATPAPPAPVTAQECLDAFDFDGDLDVDLNDFSVLSSGFGLPPN